MLWSRHPNSDIIHESRVNFNRFFVKMRNMYFLLRTDGFYSKTYKSSKKTLVVLPLVRLEKPLPDRQGLQLVKKPRRVWRRKPPNKIKIIFCRGVYLTENTSQAAESSAAALCRAQPPQAALSASQYEFVCRRRANYARSRLQKLVGKARKGFFDSLKPLPGRQGLGME